MNRRHFLHSAGILALADVCADEPAKPIRAGFLGGAHSHAFSKWQRLAESPDFTLVGIAEPDVAIRRRFEAIGAVARSEEAIIAESDVVLVESAVAEHDRQALLALRAGKHVHVEKPPSDRLEPVKEMVALAKQQQVVLQQGYMWRHHPGLLTIFEAVQAGWLGEIYMVRGAISNQLDPTERPEWARFKGGTMFELGAHMIDAIVRLMGRPDSVTPFLRTDGSATDQLRDNTLAVFQYPHAQAMVVSVNLQPDAGRHRVFEVCGTKGTAILSPMEPPTLTMDLSEAAGPYDQGKHNVPLPPYQRYVDDFRALARAIRGDQALNTPLEMEAIVQETLLKACGML